MNDSSRTKAYFVHYIGWNNRWDAWIGEDAVIGLDDGTPARAGRPSKV